MAVGEIRRAGEREGCSIMRGSSQSIVRGITESRADPRLKRQREFHRMKLRREFKWQSASSWGREIFADQNKKGIENSA